MRIILIHGYKANSTAHFFPWFTKQLIDKGHEVIAPDLPNPEQPDPDEWIQVLLDTVGAVDDETIVVGHSLGAAVALRFLEAVEAKSTPKGCVLVSAPWMINNDMFRGFFLSELDYDVLMWKASRFTVIHSRDDKVIPFDHAEKYARVLHAKLVERQEEGHFQGEQYPVVLEEIQKIIGEELVYELGMSLDDDYSELHER